MKLNSNEEKSTIYPQSKNGWIWRGFFFSLFHVPYEKLILLISNQCHRFNLKLCVCVITFSLLSIFDVRPSENKKNKTKKKCTIICNVKRMNKTEICVCVCLCDEAHELKITICVSRRRRRRKSMWIGSPSQFLKLT